MLVFDTDEHEMDYTLAKCCNPLPGDRVFGFVTTADGLKVHRDDCPNAVLLQSRFANRTLKAKWIDRKGAFSNHQPTYQWDGSNRHSERRYKSGF